MDTYIDDSGSYPEGDTMNVDPQNWVGNFDSPYGEARSAIKFDLSGVSGSVNSAVLRIYVRDVWVNGMQTPGSLPMNVYGSSNDSWNENTLSIPSLDTEIIAGLRYLEPNTWTETTVTAFVGAEVIGNQMATFVLTGASSGINQFSFSSDENVTFAPQLVVDFTPVPEPTNLALAAFAALLGISGSLRFLKRRLA